MFRQIDDSGFTLAEIVITCIIIGITAVITVPSFVNSMEQAHARDAQQNLLAIYTAQLNFSNNNGGTYYTTRADLASCGANDDTALINNPNNLNLTIINNGMNYCCYPSGGSYICRATRVGNSNFYVQLSGGVSLDLTNRTNPNCVSTDGAGHNTGFCPTY